MLNNQEYITAELEKILHEILPMPSKKLKNLVYITIDILDYSLDYKRPSIQNKPDT